MLNLSDDIIIKIFCLLNINDLINLYKCNNYIRYIINNNSNYIIINILNNYKIKIFTSDFSINLKNNKKVLSIQKTHNIFDINQIFKNKKLFNIIDEELFK